MTITLLTGDARDVLPTLPADSVHCVVTSPPYYGLRDYGTAQWDGGDAACDHSTARSRGDDIRPGDKQGTSAGSRPNTLQQCHCGARRVDRQIGLEATPEAYLATMVQVFREVRRLLRPDGTCWVNIGDSYAGNANSGGDSAPRQRLSPGGGLNSGDAVRMDGMVTKPGKPKDLLLMPARLALALQADGWWVRSAIVWAKPNPMPESVSDRPTSAYEMVYLLTRSSRYFYDADAVREASEPGTLERADYGPHRGNKMSQRINLGMHSEATTLGGYPTTRNLRNVWTLATHAFPEAHFATYPPELVERCIKAGSRPGDTVLDPFLGSGTTALVADRLQRHAIGIDLNPVYLDLAETRLVNDAGLFSNVEAPPLNGGLPSVPPSSDMADITLLDLIERGTLNTAMVECDER